MGMVECCGVMDGRMLEGVGRGKITEVSGCVGGWK